MATRLWEWLASPVKKAHLVQQNLNLLKREKSLGGNSPVPLGGIRSPKRNGLSTSTWNKSWSQLFKPGFSTCSSGASLGANWWQHQLTGVLWWSWAVYPVYHQSPGPLGAPFRSRVATAQNNFSLLMSLVIVYIELVRTGQWHITTSRFEIISFKSVMEKTLLVTKQECDHYICVVNILYCIMGY